MEFTVATIAGFLKGEIEGNPDVKVNTVAKIEEGHEMALLWPWGSGRHVTFKIILEKAEQKRTGHQQGRFSAFLASLLGK